MATLTARASFWTAAAVAGLALWASGAPSIVYPLYEADWRLDHAASTLIFAVYPMALVPVLLVFGGLSDAIGRRTTILIGLAALAAGALAFGLADGLPVVLAGRALMGVGVGLSLSPATAAMIDFGGPERAARAGSTTTASTATGLALATLVGGALIQYAPMPLHLTFWVLLAVVAVVGGFALFLPRTRDAPAAPWRPRPPLVPAGIRRPFLAGALGISAAYAVGSVILALGAQVARELIHSTDAFVDGAVLAISAVAIGVVAVLARRMRPAVSLGTGPVALVVGLAALVGAGTTHSIALFLAASLLTGAGYSLMFSGGLGLLTATAPAHHRGGVISAAYTVGYLVQALTALGLGVVATRAGLLAAIELGAVAIVLLAVAAAVLAMPGRRPARTPVPTSTTPIPVR